MVFSTLPLRTALVVTTIVTVVPLTLLLLSQGIRSPNLPMAVAITLIGVIAVPVIGTVISTSMGQRRQLAVLVAELAATRAESARLSREAGTAAERERLAREIHDTLAQGFTSIVTLAQAVEPELETDTAAAKRHVELIRATARENLAEARAMVAELTPSPLEESLPAAVQRQCDRLAAETEATVTLRIADDLPPPSMATDVVLLRAAQEAFANIRKHAHASAVTVELSPSDTGVRLAVTDNGIGLNNRTGRRIRTAWDAHPGRAGGWRDDRLDGHGWRDDADGRGAFVTASSTKVLLVDDHPVVREGLRGMIDAEADLTVVGEAGSGAEAIVMAESLQPDVILMDLRMPDVDGVTATERILALLPGTRIVVVTTYESDTDILRAVEAGAAGYLLKDASRSELAEAVRDAARGKTVLAPTVADRLVRFVRQPVSVALSTREVEVLGLVATGKTNAEIGRELHISEATVKTHLLRTFNKLGVSDRTAAVTTAMSMGLLRERRKLTRNLGVSRTFASVPVPCLRVGPAVIP